VEGILASRIDRLPPAEKELLQTLAVIGMEFPLGLAREVIKKPDDELNRLLQALQLAEFIYEQPAAGEIEYTFKHALTHDVAYNLLLTERRKLLHERTARAIEALSSERLEDYYADLARHYRLSHNAAKAVEYLRLVGEQAVGRGAYAQALANVEPALRLIERFPEGTQRLRAELSVRLMEGMTVTALYGLSSTERLQTFERVCQLSEPLGDAPALFLGLLNIGYAHTHRFEALRAREIARRCVKLAEQDLNGEMLPAACALLAQTLYRSGDLLQAESVGADAMKGLVSGYHPAAVLVSANLWAVTPGMLALVEQALGRLAEVLKFGDEALRRARQLKHSLTLASAMLLVCLLRFERREPEAAHDLAEAAIALAEEHGFREFLASGRLLRAWAMSELGQPEQGVTELEAIAASAPSVWQISK
jgi:tetratricopeptide (TPR) repeat protein